MSLVELAPRTFDLPPDRFAEAASLIDACMAAGGPCSTAEDMPLMLAPGARARRRVLEEEGRLIAHLGVYVHHYRDLDWQLDIGVVSGVVTAPEARGRGLAGTLLRDAQEWARHCGLDALVLWSEADRLYEKAGFTRAGVEVIVPLPLECATVAPMGVGVRPVREADLPHLHALHEAENGRCVRTEAMWEELLRIPHMKGWVLENRGEVVGHAFVDKGRDLEDCVHEICTSDLYLEDFLGALVAAEQRPMLYLMLPSRRRAAWQFLASLGLEVLTGPTGMFWFPDLARTCARVGIEGPPTAIASNHRESVRWLLGCGGDEEAPEGALSLSFTGLDSM